MWSLNAYIGLSGLQAERVVGRSGLSDGGNGCEENDGLAEVRQRLVEGCVLCAADITSKSSSDWEPVAEGS